MKHFNSDFDRYINDFTRDLDAKVSVVNDTITIDEPKNQDRCSFMYLSSYYADLKEQLPNLKLVISSKHHLTLNAYNEDDLEVTIDAPNVTLYDSPYVKTIVHIQSPSTEVVIDCDESSRVDLGNLYLDCEVVTLKNFPPIKRGVKCVYPNVDNIIIVTEWESVARDIKDYAVYVENGKQTKTNVSPKMLREQYRGPIYTDGGGIWTIDSTLSHQDKVAVGYLPTPQMPADIHNIKIVHKYAEFGGKLTTEVFDYIARVCGVTNITTTHPTHIYTNATKTKFTISGNTDNTVHGDIIDTDLTASTITFDIEAPKVDIINSNITATKYIETRKNSNLIPININHSRVSCSKLRLFGSCRTERDAIKSIQSWTNAVTNSSVEGRVYAGGASKTTMFCSPAGAEPGSTSVPGLVKWGKKTGVARNLNEGLTHKVANQFTNELSVATNLGMAVMFLDDEPLDNDVTIKSMDDTEEFTLFLLAHNTIPCTHNVTVDGNVYLSENVVFSPPGKLVVNGTIFVDSYDTSITNVSYYHIAESKDIVV